MWRCGDVKMWRCANVKMFRDARPCVCHLENVEMCKLSLRTVNAMTAQVLSLQATLWG